MSKEITWLLLLHHLPKEPTSLRVRVWRRLLKLGAVAVKSSAYVLPLNASTLEDFTWLRQEIEAGGGEAVIFEATSVLGSTNEEIVAAFRRDRDTAYARASSDLAGLCERLSALKGGPRPAPRDLEALQKEADAMQEELDRISEIDFFKAEGRSETLAAMKRARSLLESFQGRKPGRGSSPRGTPARDRADYQGRLWITRPRPHIDRCASAWLIRRFIDKRPRFSFAADGARLRSGIPYDMAGAEFGHRGEDCTFETLMKEFGLEADPSVRAISEIVHDVDLKDGKFGRAEAAGVNVVLRGLMAGVRDDKKLLRDSGAVFDGLYATLGAAKPEGRRKSASAIKKRK